MKNHKTFPEYSFPILSLFKIIFSSICNIPRSIYHDAKEIIKGINPPPEVIGKENLPDHSPFVIVMNHYSREGFSIVWGALSVATLFARNTCWMVTKTWRGDNSLSGKLKTLLSTVILKRIAFIYDLISTPAMPPISEEVEERAISILKLMKRVKQERDLILCIAPEGRDFPGGKLGKPAPGTGKLLNQIAKYIPTFVPIGIFEQGGMLNINIGRNFSFDYSVNVIDQDVSDLAMHEIRKLLPQHLHGKYEQH